MPQRQAATSQVVCAFCTRPSVDSPVGAQPVECEDIPAAQASATCLRCSSQCLSWGCGLGEGVAPGNEM